MKKSYLLFIVFIVLTINLFAQPQFQWAFEFGSPSACSGVDIINSTKVDNNGNLIITSSHGSNATSTPPSIDFDPGASTFMLTPSTYEGDLFIQKLDNNKNLLWVKQFGSGVGSTKGYSDIDANGNIYTFGAFLGTVDFDPSATGVFNLTATGQGCSYFILKLDNNGNFIWAKQIDNAGPSVALTYSWNASPVFIDASSNVYITADFFNVVDFDPSSNTFNLNSASGNLFIEKLDMNGNFLWVKNFGLGICNNPNGWDGDNICAIKTDAVGNIFVAGTFSTSADVDFGTGINTLYVSNGNMFVEKMDSNGNFLWVKQFGSAAGDCAYDKTTNMTIDPLGNIYTIGHFKYANDFDPGAGVAAPSVSTNSDDIFIQKLDINGNFLWVKTYGGNGIDIPLSIAIDYVNDIYVSGFFQNNVTFGSSSLTSTSSSSTFTLKLNANGTYKWAQQIDNSQALSYRDRINVIVDNTKSIYTTGSFYGTSDFDPNAGFAYLTSSGNADNVFVQKLTQQQSPDGIVDLNSSKQMQIYPNPASHNINISYSLNYDKATISLVNTLGQTIETKQFNNSEKMNFDLSSFAKGVYFINAIVDEKAISSKLIVE